MTPNKHTEQISTVAMALCLVFAIAFFAQQMAAYTSLLG